MNEPKGKIIYLNGTSSAGKTTLARELQQILPEPYLYIGIDLFIYMLPVNYWNDNPAGFTLSRSEKGTEIKGGPVAQKLDLTMIATIANLARDGNNLIVDDVILSREAWYSRVSYLQDFQPLVVGVYCPLEIVEQRERERGDREPGLAKFQYGVVHSYCTYDIEVNTALFSPMECALQIKQRLDQNLPAKGFNSN